MGFIFAFLKNEKAKVKVIGKNVETLSLLVAICKVIAERVALEKGVSVEAAESIVVDCIKDGMKYLS